MAAIPGNWYASAGLPNEAYPRSDDTVRFVYADQPNGERYIVAKVWAGDDQDYEGTAKLVAAAPALLKTLRFVLPVLENAARRGTVDSDGVNLELEAAREVADAIAEAEGRGE